MNIAYIIPLHKKDDRVFDAENSTPNDSAMLRIVVPSKEIKDWLVSKDSLLEENILVCEEGSSYPTLVNSGIQHLIDMGAKGIDFISILEFDDVVMPNTHKILEQYVVDEDSGDLVGIYAPLAMVYKKLDNPRGDITEVNVGMMNESCWAGGLPEQHGYFDYNMIIRTNLTFVNGCYIRPEVFEESGMFKENFKHFFDYEWMIRAIYNGVIVKGIPKSARKHYYYEDGAFSDSKDAGKDVIEQYLNAARTEYYFIEDRPLDIEG